MSDLRFDPVFGQWTCIAENRQTRPFEFQQFTQRRAGIDCPFCLGNESATPPAIAEWSAIEGKVGNDGHDSNHLRRKEDWLVRVLPNKYPSLDQETTVTDTVGKRPGDQPKTPNGGFQEVIVLSPRHVASLSGLNDNELFASFAMFRQRLKHHREQATIGHICIFMNCRPMAGATIEHAHFQLIGSPVCTPQVRERIRRMNETVCNESGTSVWQEILNWEIETESRVLERSSDFVVFCPFASRYSNQIRIAPLGKVSDTPYADMSVDQCRELARLCRRWVGGIERCLDDPAYNLIFHLPPCDLPDSPWFVDLTPRFPQAAGFELATDCWMNPVSPEQAADHFRQYGQLENDAG